MNIDTTTFNKENLYPKGKERGYGPQYRNGPRERPADAIKSIIVHTTNGNKGTRFENEAGFLYRSPDVSAHFLVGKQGQVAQLLHPLLIAWHTGTVNDPECDNDSSIGIECHLTVGEAWSDEQRNALSELVISLLRKYPTISKIRTHREVAVFADGPKKGKTGRKSDPEGWSDMAFASWVARMFAAATGEPTVQPAKPTLVLPPAQLSEPGYILAAPSATKEQATKYIIQRGRTGEYTPYDIRSIVDSYWQHATAVGVDPVLLIAQCIHETGNFASWWAGRPRRNPAGIGVTGQVVRGLRPVEGVWQRDIARGEWRHGYAFATWDAGIQAHVGHILAYALADEAMTPAQRAMSEKSPRKPAIPAHNRGIARHITDLNGRWAVPGKEYGQRILAVLTAIQNS